MNAARSPLVLIDADGCPVVDSSVALARRYGRRCLIFCDTAHEIAREGAETIVCSKGTDSADFALLCYAAPGTVVVTQDYGLAALCLAKGGRALDQNGRVYTAQTIDALLASRHVAKKLRRAGVRLRGPKKRSAQNDADFARALEALLKQEDAQ